jgi:hypothetical protein
MPYLSDRCQISNLLSKSIKERVALPQMWLHPCPGPVPSHQPRPSTTPTAARSMQPAQHARNLDRDGVGCESPPRPVTSLQANPSLRNRETVPAVNGEPDPRPTTL